MKKNEKELIEALEKLLYDLKNDHRIKSKNLDSVFYKTGTLIKGNVDEDGWYLEYTYWKQDTNEIKK
jgi:hypothetical protein